MQSDEEKQENATSSLNSSDIAGDGGAVEDQAASDEALWQEQRKLIPDQVFSLFLGCVRVCWLD